MSLRAIWSTAERSCYVARAEKQLNSATYGQRESDNNAIVSLTLQITHSKKKFSLYFLCISFGLQKNYFFKERKKLLDSETRHFEQVFFLLHLALSTKGVNGNWADNKGCLEIACNLAPKA